MVQSELRLERPCENTGGPDLERVRGKLGPVILKGARSVWRRGQHEFHINDIIRWVWAQPGNEWIVADSISRTLRALRLEGYLDYEVVNRSQSLYRLTRIVMFGDERLP